MKNANLRLKVINMRGLTHNLGKNGGNREFQPGKRKKILQRLEKFS
jgi:hypothetical protein